VSSAVAVETVKRRSGTFVGRSDDAGQLRFPRHEAERYRERLRLLSGKRVEIDVREYKSRRSERANNYYWSSVADVIAKDQEMTAEELHDAMCERFLPNEHQRIEFFNRMTGESLTVETDGRRSSKLEGGKFFDFVERVREFGRDFLGVQTEPPDPEYWRKNRS
jgi:hypothetical protein